MDAANPFAWIEALRDGGPWAIVVALAIVCIYLWRAYVKARDTHETKIEAVHLKVISMVEKNIENNTALRSSLEASGDAQHNIERRLENVEKALAK